MEENHAKIQQLSMDLTSNDTDLLTPQLKREKKFEVNLPYVVGFMIIINMGGINIGYNLSCAN